MKRYPYLHLLLIFLLASCVTAKPITMPPATGEAQEKTATKPVVLPGFEVTPTTTGEQVSAPTIPATDERPPFQPESAQVIEVRVDDLLSRMSLEEKVGQMTQVENGSIDVRDITSMYIGSILSGGGGSPSDNSAGGWAEMVNNFQKYALQTPLAIPLIYGVDAVHGHGNLRGATIFPHNIGLGATRDPDLTRQIGRATALEMLATGIPWNFAPVVAVVQDIRWGRTYEGYSEDSQVVVDLATAYIQGLQSVTQEYAPAPGQTFLVGATAKHYLGDGATAWGTSIGNAFDHPYRLDQGDMRFDEATVIERFLPPYQAAVKNDVMSVMVSFSSWNGLKMHANQLWINEVLKGEMGFQGFVVSDWGGIDQIPGDYYSDVVTSINAGIDMVMVPYDYKTFIAMLIKAVKNGDVPQARIDDAVRRILRAKFRLGLFDHPYADPNLLPIVGSDAHRQLARQAVRESLVLLKNENNILPLSKATPVIFLAGRGANSTGMQCGGWTIEWQGVSTNVQPGTTILEAMKAAVLPSTRLVYNSNGKFASETDASGNLLMADVGIAVVGEQPYAEGVGDMQDLSLSQTDKNVIDNLHARSKVLVVIILSGRPVIITDYYETAEAWVAAWWPGTEAAGITDVLFGDYAFVGRLPYTWPRSNDQLPINIHNAGNLTGCEAPLFPFGYGLGTAGSQPIEWMNCP